MKKFRFIVDVTVEGNDDVTPEEIEDGIDFDLDGKYDSIAWDVLSGREL